MLINSFRNLGWDPEEKEGRRINAIIKADNDSFMRLKDWFSKADSGKKKKFSFTGQDFTVPDNYKKGTDENDIAWLDLREYHEEKTKNGITLNWSLSELPSTTFRTSRIPDDHGPLKDVFAICGKLGA